MLDVLLLWSKSDDAGVQDEMISKLLPIMKETPGLRRLRVNEGDLMARGGPPPYSRVIEASFGSLAGWPVWMRSGADRISLLTIE